MIIDHPIEILKDLTENAVNHKLNKNDQKCLRNLNSNPTQKKRLKLNCILQHLSYIYTTYKTFIQHTKKCNEKKNVK